MANDKVSYRAIKYRVYPTEEQSEKLSQTFGCARKVYNDALSMQRGLHEAGARGFVGGEENQLNKNKVLFN